jgi:hypothetical protein
MERRRITRSEKIDKKYKDPVCATQPSLGNIFENRKIS